MRNLNLTDTITAISTPLGDAGIGIVRLNGKNALAIADKIFISKDKLKPSGFKSHTTHYGWVVDRNQVIDEVLLTVMRAPKTYTKENIVEINCHSGIVPLRKILDLALAQGARLAEPGEFTRRAFLNGRIDLTQAEAVLDIIKAKTDASFKVSVEQLKGKLSKEIKKMRQGLLGVLGILEANIDFPDEEDTQKIDLVNLQKRLKDSTSQIGGLLDSFARGRVLREGVLAVICGVPNVGKSSLLNCLLKQERAIVTHIPGTTRDTIEETLDIRGIPLRIVDTAGIIEPRDLIEKKAVSRSRMYLKNADLVLLVLDANKKLSGQDFQLIRKTKLKRVIAVINKIDLPMRIELDKIKSNFAKIAHVSALKNKGIADLEKAICDTVGQGGCSSGDGILVCNLRHKVCLEKAREFLKKSLGLLNKNFSLEFICLDLKEAIDSLGEITGESGFQEEMLEKIFSEFCIGK